MGPEAQAPPPGGGGADSDHRAAPEAEPSAHRPARLKSESRGCGGGGGGSGTWSKQQEVLSVSIGLQLAGGALGALSQASVPIKISNGNDPVRGAVQA